MADVFVSYARHDKARVAPLVAAIEASGLVGLVGPGDFEAGQEFDRPDRRGAKDCYRRPRGLDPEHQWNRDGCAVRHATGRSAASSSQFALRTCGDADRRTGTFHTTDLDDWERDPQSPQSLQEVLLRSLGAMIKRQRKNASVSQAVTAISSSAG
jgi:adenylate cyclase